MPFINLGSVDVRELLPGYHGRFIHTDRVTVAYWNIDAGSPLPEHSHPHEQVTSLVEGAFELVIDGQARILGPGDVAVIPGGARHSGRSVTECRLVDIFSPVREDYR
jgi:quercetin dioxygenase-like cupin family protein